MDKNFAKSAYISFIIHIIIIICFAFLSNFPSFDQKVNFEPISIEISNNLISTNFTSNISNTQEVGKLNQTMITNKNEIVKPDTIDDSKTKTNTETKTKTDKTEEKIEDKPLISPISTQETSNNTNKQETSVSNPSNSSESSQADDGQEENSDSLVQQLISSQISGSGQSSKDNIQWNAGANRWVVKKVKPTLPNKYKEKGHTITCKIYIEINKFGSVISAIIVQSTGYVELDQYIISIIKDWKFNQVTYDKIDSGYITIIFEFS